MSCTTWHNICHAARIAHVPPQEDLPARNCRVARHDDRNCRAARKRDRRSCPRYPGSGPAARSAAGEVRLERCCWSPCRMRPAPGIFQTNFHQTTQLVPLLSFVWSASPAPLPPTSPSTALVFTYSAHVLTKQMPRTSFSHIAPRCILSCSLLVAYYLAADHIFFQHQRRVVL